MSAGSRPNKISRSVLLTEPVDAACDRFEAANVTLPTTQPHV